MALTAVQAEEVLRQGRALIGKTYADMDCSHFVCEAYKQAGLEYAYASTAAFVAGRAGREGPFSKVDTTEPAPADVLLFKGHMGLWDPEGCTVLGTNAECKRLNKDAPVLSSRSGQNHGPDYGRLKWFGDFTTYRWVGFAKAVGIKDLRVGLVIRPIRMISPAMVSHWKYAKECASVGGGLMPGALMKVVQTSTQAGAMWVRAAIPGRTPEQCLKIAGEEFGANFELAP